MKGLLFVYFLTIVGTVGSVFNPLIGLFVYVGFATLRPQSMWGYAANFDGISQAVGVAFLVGWAFKRFGGLAFGRGRTAILALLTFSAWAFLSAVQARFPQVGIAWSIEMLKVVFPLMAGVTLLNSDKLVRAMLWVIVAAHTYVGYQMNSSYYFYGYNRIVDAGYGGMDNNSFGLSFVTVLGPAIGLGLAARKWPERLLALGSIAIILHTILLTYSRGAMVGMIAVVFAGFAILPKRPTTLALVFAVTLLGLRLSGPQIVARFESIFAEVEERDGSAQSRIDLTRACLQIGLSNPIFGIGTKNFPLVATEYGFTPGKETHSTWMGTLAEMGFPGLAALVLFYLVTAARLWPLARGQWSEENRTNAAMAAGVLMSLVGFFISAQFVSMTGLETPYYVAMVGLALLRSAPATTKQTATSVATAPGSGYAQPPAIGPAVPASAGGGGRFNWAPPRAAATDFEGGRKS